MYVFDFDKTIYDGDSSIDFYLFCLKHNILSLKMIPKLIVGFIKYRLKLISKTELKSVYFSFVADTDDIKKLVNEFWKKKKIRIKPFFLNRKHDKDVVISASPDFLIKDVLNEIGVENVIATRVNPLTGELLSKNCFGEEKVKRYKIIYGDALVEEMYSDSYSDKPLFDLAKKSYIVKSNNISLLNKKKNINKNELIWYLFIGILTVIINIAIKTILLITILNPKSGVQLQISIIVSWTISVIFSFFANKVLTFKNKSYSFIKQILMFIMSRIFTLVIEMGYLYLFVTKLQLNTNILVAFFTLTSQGIVIIINYFTSKYLVFKKNNFCHADRN